MPGINGLSGLGFDQADLVRDFQIFRGPSPVPDFQNFVRPGPSRSRISQSFFPMVIRSEFRLGQYRDDGKMHPTLSQKLLRIII